MKAKIFSLFLFLGFTSLSCSQDILNQFDDKGKKHGKWIVYLDNEWKGVKDSSEAIFYRYTYFDHGTNLYPMGSFGKKWKLESSTCDPSQSDKVKLLDGEYKWIDKDGRAGFIFVIKNGEFISYKEFHPTGELHQHFDYLKKWEGQEHSWCINIYDKKGHLTHESYMKKDKDGNWPRTRSE